MAREEDEQVPDSIDAREIFDLIRSINDLEHPLTLEELNVVEQVRVQVSDPESTVAVAFTPTVPHCSMATLIGLSIKVKLLRSLPQRVKMDVHITPGTHASEHAVNKQLADKERVAAREYTPAGDCQLVPICSLLNLAAGPDLPRLPPAPCRVHSHLFNY
nr:cytosolic iron-sulfur assembly component 2B-like [Oryctolagus cuniculus]